MSKAVRRGEMIVMEMTKAEATALCLVTQAIGGPAKETLRGEIDNLRHSLFDAGISTYTIPGIGQDGNYTGGYYNGSLTFLPKSGLLKEKK